MFERILMVCTGNLCRSPMAGAWLRHRLGERPIEVRSAGLAARVGDPAAPHAVAVLAKRGVDLSAHRARQLTTEDVLGSDLVLVMEDWQKEEVQRRTAAARGRTYLLGHWQGIEISDPYGAPEAVFEGVFAQIDQAVDAWLAHL